MKIFWFLQSGDDYFSSVATRRSLRKSRQVIWLAILMLVSLVTWAYWAEIDQITRAPGEVIASSKTQVVQSQEGGVLQALMVKEGDRVERGDAVATLERTQAESAFLEALARKAGLSAAISRLKSEVFGSKLKFEPLLEQYPEFVSNQKALFEKRQGAIQQQVSSLKSMLGLIDKELDLNRPLIATGDVSTVDVLRLERQQSDLKSQIASVNNNYLKESQAELNALLEEYAGIEQQVALRKDRLDRLVLVAPVNGIVKNIAITTEGGVIRPGEDVMQIVPVDDALVIEAKIAPSEIAFIQEGMSATIKIDAYDYTVYGDLEGTLTYISADTLREQLANNEAPYYRVQVVATGSRFSGTQGRELEILPGMTATVEVKTGKNTVLSYLTKPLVKTIAESMGER